MISVVVPVMNEEDNIWPLVKEITEAAATVPITEIVYVDDASTDKTADVLSALKAEYPLLRVIRHNKRAGQSAALWTGVKAAKNEVIR